MRLEHSDYRDTGFTVARCYSCGWSYRNAVRGRVDYRVRQHVEAYGHPVEVVRSQRKTVQRVG